MREGFLFKGECPPFCSGPFPGQTGTQDPLQTPRLYTPSVNIFLTSIRESQFKGTDEKENGKI